MGGLLDADTQRPGPSRPGVRLVDSLDGLAVVAEPDVVAAIWAPPALPRWHAELVTALRDHRFTIPRTVLTDVVPGAVDAWLRRQAGAEALTASTLDHL